MSEESDNEDGSKTRHSPKWRSDSKCIVYMPKYQDVIPNFVYITALNSYIRKLDDRNAKKLGNRYARCATRVYGDVLDVSPPKSLPRWMLGQDYQRLSEPHGRGDVSDSANRTPPPTSTPAQDSYGHMYSFSDVDLNSSV